MIRGALRIIDRRPLVVLAGLIAVAATARFVLALGSDTPWIFADEFIYSELARSLAASGELLVRGEPVYFSTLVPLLHAPGYLLGDTATAYAWIKLANSLAMCAAAVPAYALARMALGVRLSITFAVAVLAWPAFAYTATVMTEPLFFTALMGFAWALARALHRPTLATQAVVALVLAAALLVRLQAGVVLVSIPVACVLVALLAPGAPGALGALARLRAYWPLLVVSIGLPLLALLVQAARSRPVRSLLGGYGGAEIEVALDVIADWTVWHVAVVALSVGVVPLALAAGAWTRALSRRWSDGGAGAGVVLVTSLAIAVPVLIQVAVFASNHSLRVQERNLFGIEPLVLLAALIGLAVVGVGRVAPVAAAVLLALALADLPVDHLLVPQPPLSDTFSLLALMKTASTTGITASSLAIIAGILGVALTAAAVTGGRRVAVIALPALAIPLLLVMNAQVTPMLRDYSDRTADANVPQPANWVDQALPADATAMFVWASEDTPTLAWQTEFWNESIGPILAVPAPFPTLNGALGAIDPATGRVVPPPGAEIPDAEYVVTPGRWEIAGTEVGRASAAGVAMRLWRIDGPLRLSATTEGLYADGWTGATMTVRHFECVSGRFVLRLRSGYGRDRWVTITSGEVTREVRVRRGRERAFRVPARPDPATGTCVLTVAPRDTATGVELGNPADPRELGLLAKPVVFEEDA